jgi:hypothetical protein
MKLDSWTNKVTDMDMVWVKISGGGAPENCIFFINWGMATDIKLKDYIS